MTPRYRRGTLIGLALLILGLVGLVGVSLTSALVYYVTPTELLARSTTGSVRLYGVVVPGSVRRDAGSAALAFQLTDGTTTLDVVTDSMPTALFRDGIAVVLAGRLGPDRSFTADEVLIKHSEVYQPLKPGETIPPGVLDASAGASP